jgi:hypothetical protein
MAIGFASSDTPLRPFRSPRFQHLADFALAGAKWSGSTQNAVGSLWPGRRPPASLPAGQCSGSREEASVVNGPATNCFAASGASLRSLGCSSLQRLADFTFSCTKRGRASQLAALMGVRCGWAAPAFPISLGFPVPSRRAASHMKAFLHHLTIGNATSISSPGKKL